VGLAGSATVAADIPLEFSVAPGRILYGLLALIAMFILASTLGVVGTLGFGQHGIWTGLYRFFYLDKELTIPTYFSALQLLAAAVMLGLIARHQALIGSPWRWHFLLLAVGFVILSVDETASIHETVLGWLGSRLGRIVPGYTFSTWLGPAIIIVAVVGLSYLRFLLALPRRFAALVVASGAIFLAGAVGAEWVALDMFEERWSYQIEVIVEEGLEMVGIALFLYALLTYFAQARIALVIRTKP
jgi:hypothetical protein